MTQLSENNAEKNQKFLSDKISNLKSQAIAEKSKFSVDPEKIDRIIKNYSLTILGSALITLVLLGASIACFASSTFIAAIILAALAVCAILTSLAFTRQRSRTIKYTLVSNVIDQYFQSSLYLAVKSLSHDKLDDANIVDDWDKAYVSDYFVGVWKDYNIEFGDLTLRGKDKIGKSNVLFSGQLFIIQLKSDVKIPVSIRERTDVLTPDDYEARKNSDRFFMTGNETFDRQFEVKFGNTNRASGFEETIDGMSPDAQRAYVHSLIDNLTNDIISADSYASSRTLMRFFKDRLYVAIENSRDTFEFKRSDLRHIKLLKERFDEEAQTMTSYLDLITHSLPKL